MRKPAENDDFCDINQFVTSIIYSHVLSYPTDVHQQHRKIAIYDNITCKNSWNVVGNFWKPDYWKIDQLEFPTWKVLFIKLENGKLFKGDFATSYFPTSYSTLRHKTFQLLHFLNKRTTKSSTTHIENSESEEWIYWSFIFMQKLEWKPWIRHDLGYGVFNSLVLPSWVWAHAVRYYSIHAVVMGY